MTTPITRAIDHLLATAHARWLLRAGPIAKQLNEQSKYDGGKE